MVRTIERILERRHQVSGFSEPRRALEAARSLRPQVAIIDVQMPDLDGFELTRALKEIDPLLRVILMTGSAFGADEKLIRAIEEQAFYFIHKPFDRKVLRALVARCLELRRLESENRRWVAHLEAQLEGARAFQQAMLPEPRARLGRLEVHTAYRPSLELAGDLCDYVPCDAEGTTDGSAPSVAVSQVALLIADVVGHGASAAMLTALVKSSFHAARAEGYAPEAVVRRVSEGIAAFAVDRFVTLVAARVDLDTGVVELVNAGHEAVLIATPIADQSAQEPSGRFTVRTVGSTGPLISPAPIFAGIGWRTVREAFPPGARLLLTTDGIVETQRDGEELGVGPLIAALESGRSGEELIDTILGAVERFAPGDAADDRTLLTARFDDLATAGSVAPESVAGGDTDRG